MNNWKEYRFSDFVDINPTVKLSKEEKISFVEMKDLNDGKRYCFPSQEKELSGGSKFKEGDTLFARITPCLENGKICQVKGLKNGQGFGSTEFHVFRGKENISNSDFVYYLSRWDDVRSHAEINLDGTSGRQRVPKEAFNDLILTLPPLPEQRAIASVLSSLDDKIDLLHRQNATLEKMAETLFRQWFVEEAKEEWEEKPISFFGNVICGKTPPKLEKTYFGGLIPFIKIPDMHGKVFVFETEDSLTENGKRSQNNKTLPPFSISVSCIATVGLVTLNAYEAQTNQQINSIIPYKEEYRYYLYLYMKSLYDELHNMASGGTATLNLNTGNFSKIGLPYPSQNRLDKFHSRVEILFDKIYSNSKQIRTLTSLRDTLLPKLMSGEVKIKIYSI